MTGVAEWLLRGGCLPLLRHGKRGEEVHTAVVGVGHDGGHDCILTDGVQRKVTEENVLLLEHHPCRLDHVGNVVRETRIAFPLPLRLYEESGGLHKCLDPLRTHTSLVRYVDPGAKGTERGDTPPECIPLVDWVALRGKKGRPL